MLYPSHSTLLYALHSPLPTPHSTLCTVPLTLYIWHFTSPIHTLQFTFHILHSTLQTLHSTLCIPHSPLYTPHLKFYSPTPHYWALYTPQSTVCTPHSTFCTLHSTHSTPFTFRFWFLRSTLHSTLYTLHCTLQTPFWIVSTLDTFTLQTPHFTRPNPHSTLRHWALKHSNAHLHPTLSNLVLTLHSPLNISLFIRYVLHSTLFTRHSAIVRSQGKNVQNCWNSLFRIRVLRVCVRVRWLVLFWYLFSFFGFFGG